MTTPIISVSELHALLPRRPLLLDCRFDLFDLDKGQEDYRAGHIPGAHYLHLNDDLSGEIIPGKTGRHPLPDRQAFADRMAALGLTPDRPVVAYDDKGGGIAARAWWLLKWIGHEKVAVLDGGFPAWQTAGLPIVAGQEQATPAPPYPTAFTELLRTCDRAQVERLRSDEAHVLIDSRTSDRYRGENENIDPVAGAIAGAINLPWPDNLENGKFKSREALRERFAGLKKEPQQNVFYCGSGVTACHNILAYYYAFGELPALYPGSWSEYLLGE
ncbi:thiosulfate/3-mercaptopyruvate sulfurtransferase [Lewinella aquimaris]|uniref:Thiosulfate/3-mercaptopyruvate sulfurtransferase n=1 Tax=Neolewinella aquimaris TaxID=1835722 RepID=A0A840ECE3_9BACT|nr:sulfurtransferase [Neolewinella aquimaris]MBB4079469.1 thiosulfate/3-mercaptopyruvate sulfurtransferase [Neolewinella aquimaris]